MKIRLLISLFCLIACYGQAQQAVELDALLFQKIPTRDGTKLSADIYKPRKMAKPLPAIMVLTPYGANEKVDRAMYFARRGYVFVTVDCRGRGHSEGVFTPFEDDGKDGHDAVEWIAKQPWCNGQVGMMGGSYRGMVQWMTLKNFPPHLKSIVPTASVGPGIDFPKKNGIFYKYAARWLALVNGKSYNDAIFSAYKYWQQKNLNSFKNHMAYEDFAQYTGSNVRVFKKWVAHPDFDAYWQQFYPTSKDYQKMNIPTLTITGYYDGDQPGALHYYNQHMKYGNSAAKQKHYLIVGPWTHGGTRKPAKSFGKFKFGDNAVIDMNKLHLDWFDWTLKGKASSKPAFLKDKVAYYETGTNQWRYQSTFKPFSDKNLTLYLSSQNGQANDHGHPAWLKSDKPTNQQGTPDSFVYDPLDQSITKDWATQVSLSKQNFVVYQSQPLKEDIVITGHLKAKLYLSLNTPDTDLLISVYEVTADGETQYLRNDFLRARYRESLTKSKMITPGKVLLYTLDKAWYFSKKIKKGSAIRLVISPLDWLSYQHNYNSGKDVSKETAKDAKTCTIKVYHSAKYPSRLVLPLDTNSKK